MLINFIAFIICTAFSILNGIDGKIGVCILEASLALLNLPYVIQYIMNLFNKD